MVTAAPVFQAFPLLLTWLLLDVAEPVLTL